MRCALRLPCDCSCRRRTTPTRRPVFQTIGLQSRVSCTSQGAHFCFDQPCRSSFSELTISKLTTLYDEYRYCQSITRDAPRPFCQKKQPRHCAGGAGGGGGNAGGG